MQNNFVYDVEEFCLCNTDDRNPVGLVSGQKIQWDADREQRIAIYEKRVQRGELIFQIGDSRKPSPHTPALWDFLTSPAYQDFSEEFDKSGGSVKITRRRK